MLNKACEYGIKAMIFIAQESNDAQLVSLKKIAKGINSPEAFTAKILQKLTRGGLLESSKGPAGGFKLSGSPESFHLARIVKTIDGDGLFTNCVLGLKQCGDAKPCPVHHKFAGVKENLKKVFYSTTLEEAAKGYSEGKTFLTY